MDDSVLSYFVVNIEEIVVLLLLFVSFVIQLYYYLAYYRKPLASVNEAELANENRRDSRPKVSVIIVSENEANLLSEHLPAILEQDYPDYEVIVVNNGSTDESDALLQSLKLRHPHLYQTYLPYSADRNYSRRKLALTLGIKAAKGDILLFTEPYCKPISNNWIALMTEGIDDSRPIAIGYAYYTNEDGFMNRIARFDNHLFSMQYLSFAIKGKPFIGVYRNIAFKKRLFFENKGFASYLNIDNGEDIFVHDILTSHYPAVVLAQDSFVEASLESFSLWRQIKKTYSLAKSYFSNKTIFALGLEPVSRYTFYVSAIFLFVYSGFLLHHLPITLAILLLIVRLSIQSFVINKSSLYFRSGKFYFSLILLDILQPIYNIKFRTRNKKNFKK